MMNSALLLIIITLVHSRLLATQKVVTLDSVSFDKTLETLPLVFVNFFAPWCSHCKTLSQTLKVAATKLKSHGITGTIAQFDATAEENEEIAEKEGIVGFPTLAVYKFGQKIGEYNGQRTEKDILEFLKIKSDPAAKRVKLYSEIVPYIANLDSSPYGSNQILSVVLGCFVSPVTAKDSLYHLYMEVASSYDLALFFVTESVDVLSTLNITQDSMVIFTSDNGHAHSVVLPFKYQRSDTVNDLNSNNSDISNDRQSNNDNNGNTSAGNLEQNSTDKLVCNEADAVVSIDGRDSISDSNSGTPSSSVIPEITQESIMRAILEESLPTTLRYSAELQPVISALPIREHVLLFYSESDPAQVDWLHRAESLSRQFKGRLVFIEVEAAEYQVLQYFHLNSGDLPQIVVADMTEIDDLRKYSLAEYLQSKPSTAGTSVSAATTATATGAASGDSSESPKSSDEVTEASAASQSIRVSALDATEGDVEAFLNAFLRNDLAPSLQSEPLSTLVAANANLKTDFVENIVGDNFNEKVLNAEGVDSLVYVYAPWCAHCKSVEPIIYAVAKALRSDPLFRVFRIDGTKNDIGAATTVVLTDSEGDENGEKAKTNKRLQHSGVKVKGFPAIFLYSSRQDGIFEPVEYAGERSVEAIVSFINDFRN